MLSKVTGKHCVVSAVRHAGNHRPEQYDIRDARNMLICVLQRQYMHTLAQLKKQHHPGFLTFLMNRSPPPPQVSCVVARNCCSPRGRTCSLFTVERTLVPLWDWIWTPIEYRPGGPYSIGFYPWNMDPPIGKWTPLHSYPNFAAYYPNFVAYYVHCLSKLETL